MSYITLYLANSRQFLVPVPGSPDKVPSCTEAVRRTVRPPTYIQPILNRATSNQIWIVRNYAFLNDLHQQDSE